MLHYTPMFILGMQGMPRRYFDYLPVYESGNFLAGIGAWIMVAGLLLILINIFLSLKNGGEAPADPWGGTTLEWKTSSPPPVHNFTSDAEIGDYPYDFSGVIRRDKER